MAGSVNKVIIVGNLGKDPESRSLGSSGDRVVNLSVATSDTWKDKSSGERKEKTEWHRVAIFNEHHAKVAEQYLRKGSKVYLEGQLQTRKWEKDGQEQRSTEVVLTKFRGELTLLDGKNDGGDGRRDDRGDDRRDDRRSSGGSAGSGAGRGFNNDLDDDIPFAPEVRG